MLFVIFFCWCFWVVVHFVLSCLAICYVSHPPSSPHMFLFFSRNPAKKISPSFFFGFFFVCKCESGTTGFDPLVGTHFLHERCGPSLFFSPLFCCRPFYFLHTHKKKGKPSCSSKAKERNFFLFFLY